MRIGILTNEYPPNVYGGAGVHVEYLTRELAALDGGRHSVHVLCFGDQRSQDGNLTVHGVQPPPGAAGAGSAPRPRLRHAAAGPGDERRAAATSTSSTATPGTRHFAGCLVKQLQGVPLVLTTHSLEPHRPWKVEQLGTAYHVSTWVERTAYQNADGVVAVSQSMRADVHALYGVPHDRIRVIHNGIDLDQYRPTPDPAAAGRIRHRSRRSRSCCSSAASPGRRASSTWSTRSGISAPACRSCCVPARPTRRRSAGRWPKRSNAARTETPHTIVWIREMLPQRQGDRALHARRGLRLPVGLRAVRHHQPGGDGLRDAGGRLGGRRHSRGGRPRRDRAAGADRSGRAPADVEPQAPGAASRATWPPPSTRCSTTRRCATAMGRKARAPRRSSNSAGRASRGRRWRSTSS